MNHEVSSLETVIDVVGGLVEKFADVEALVIFCWDVEKVGNLVFGVSKFYAFGGGEDCLDGMF